MTTFRFEPRTQRVSESDASRETTDIRKQQQQQQQRQRKLEQTRHDRRDSKKPRCLSG